MNDVIDGIRTYFSAEKRESVLFVVAGVSAIAASIVLLRGSSAWRFMAVPLIAIGLVQVSVGAAVFVRTDAQLAAIESRVAREPVAVQRDERARMEKVMASFRLYKWIEFAVLAAGVALVFAVRYGAALHAVGAGMLLQGALMLVLDLFAEGRGHEYLHVLARLG